MLFIQSVKTLMTAICRDLPELAHVDLRCIHVTASACRGRRCSGTVAYILPLRFRGGSPVEVVVRLGRAYYYAYFPCFLGGVEIMYSIHFLLPRFLNLKPFEKIETIIHELYHSSP